MLKVKKIVVFLFISVLIVCFSFTASAMTSTYVQPGQPSFGSLIGTDSSGTEQGFETIYGFNSTGESWRSYSLRPTAQVITQLHSAILTVPIKVDVPDGNYWTLSGIFHCRFRVGSGMSSQNAIVDQLTVSFYPEGGSSASRKILDISPRKARFDFSTSPTSSSSGTLSFTFRWWGNIENPYAVYFDLINTEINYGLQSEFSNRQERNEFTQDGESAVGDVQSSAPDNSGGFVSALGSFVNSMSYNGTVCKWKFPSIKLPAINGVMSETTLNDEQDIDFGFWVGKIPSNILEIVQILCTLALIVYCFKELYSTIQYVLTLKGGGDNG